MDGIHFTFDGVNALYYDLNTVSLSRGMRYAYKSKYNLKRENQAILLMITDGEKSNYLAVKSLSALLRGITSNDNGDFYCLNHFCSYTTKELKNVCKNHDYCYVEMPICYLC